MPKGIYQHHPHQCFQKGNLIGFKKGMKKSKKAHFLKENIG